FYVVFVPVARAVLLLSGLRVEAAAVRQRRAYAYRQSFGSCGLLAAVNISRQSWCGFGSKAESEVVAVARSRVRIRARLHVPNRGGQSCDAAEGASGKNVTRPCCSRRSGRPRCPFHCRSWRN